MIGRLITPPTFPVSGLSPILWAIHITAHDESTRIRQGIQFGAVFFRLIEHPVVERVFGHVAKGFFKGQVRPCHESIQ